MSFLTLSLSLSSEISLDEEAQPASEKPKTLSQEDVISLLFDYRSIDVIKFEQHQPLLEEQKEEEEEEGERNKYEQEQESEEEELNISSSSSTSYASVLTTNDSTEDDFHSVNGECIYSHDDAFIEWEYDDYDDDYECEDDFYEEEIERWEKKMFGGGNRVASSQIHSSRSYRSKNKWKKERRINTHVHHSLVDKECKR